MNSKLKKKIILNLPYILFALVGTKVGHAYRIAEGTDLGTKFNNIGEAFGIAFENYMPSFHPTDMVVGVLIGVIMWFIVYNKGKNAKKYRHGVEHGSARWGNSKDIEPFVDTTFDNNVILTQTERLMMGSRPKEPKHARNKNVLIIGGSGSGKTRFWLKPNLMQMHSSYVVTDPKGYT
ncbi:MAG: type IV secretory system conjugative DNA transfer family protein [Eubacteriales bacterium]